MCLEVKIQKAKNGLFIWTLKCSKQFMRQVFIRGWNENSNHRVMCLQVLKNQERCTADDFPS